MLKGETKIGGMRQITKGMALFILNGGVGDFSKGKA